MPNRVEDNSTTSGDFHPGMNPSSATRVRQHSVRMVAAVQSWQASLVSPETEQVKAVYATWCELLRALAGEGSFLGFPRISKLCRVLHSALENQIALDQPMNPEQHESVQLVARALAELVVDPTCQSVNTAAVAQQLRLAFELTEHEMAKTIPHINYLQDTELKRESLSAVHRDLDIYLSARLDSLDRCLEEETWIVSQLASLAEDLACGMQSQRPANRVMGVLRSHKFFHQVDRVCLAGRVPATNQLMVVDSAFSDRCETNLLKPGYACFVNPDGSLFNMRPGTMRIFDDSARVLDSFAASGKPAQRSIALIGDMGLRSGLCLAIGREGELQGFLFLNSCQPELFRDITLRFAPLISLLGLVATIALDSNGFHKGLNKPGTLDSELPRCSMLFDVGEFQNYLYRALQRRFGSSRAFYVTAEMSGEMDDFLYLPSQICGALAEIALRLQLFATENGVIKISISQEGSSVVFGLEHHCNQAVPGTWSWLRDQVDYFSTAVSNTPVKLAVRETEVIVQVPFEPVLQSHRGLRYSVVF